MKAFTLLEGYLPQRGNVHAASLNLPTVVSCACIQMGARDIF